MHEVAMNEVQDEGGLTNLMNLRSEYAVLGEQLLLLPQSIAHHIMVPVGTQALFPGKLVKTNEVTVLLGDNYFVKCSSHHARTIVIRRLEVIERKISAAEKQVHEFQLRVTRQFYKTICVVFYFTAPAG